MQRLKRGFRVHGPYSEAEVSHKLGTTDWGLTTRFALYQGEGKKIRIIDNYRDSAVNSAFTATSYIALQDTDFVVGLLRFFMQIARHQEEVVVELSNGRVLRKWRCSMKKRPKLLGRCVDLSKAYKQVAIDCQSLVHGVFGASDSTTWLEVVYHAITAVWGECLAVRFQQNFSSTLASTGAQTGHHHFSFL